MGGITLKPNSEQSKPDLNRLLQYHDFFHSKDNIFYSSINGYWVESKEILAFRRDVYDSGFLIIFNWSDWLNKNEIFKNLEGIKDYILNADLETLRKLMTSYIRGDRFTEGLFLRACNNGNIALILERIKELKLQTQE